MSTGNVTFVGPCGDLLQALLRAKKEFAPLLRTKENPFHKSKYADLNALLDVCEDALAKEGILVVQAPGGDGTLMTLTTALVHAATGGVMASTVTLPLSKQSAQDAGSAITYARRYGLQAMLCLAAEDDDGARASGRVKADKPRNAGPTPQQARAMSERRQSQAHNTTDEPSPDWPIAKEQERVRTRMRQVYGEGNGNEKLLVVAQFWGIKKKTAGEAWAAFKALGIVPLMDGRRKWERDLVDRKIIPESELDDLPADFGKQDGAA